MTGFDGRQLTLSQSFWFGRRLADEANRWLSIVESPPQLRGTPTIDTCIGPLGTVDALLCRTNGGAIAEIFHAAVRGHKGRSGQREDGAHRTGEGRWCVELGPARVTPRSRPLPERG
ncbi:hypothetical protein ACIRQP_33870 [Streptomyces sp. NPDC102274]|uniref:hypothetical protein n=1 Tax=Streptomyces sp. NPDC102274 TaxID=3366151 RepID=UPI0038218B1C